MTQSLWVIRNRDTGDWWNGFGFTPLLKEALTFQTFVSRYETSWIPFPVDVLELRLIERDSDG